MNTKIKTVNGDTLKSWLRVKYIMVVCDSHPSQTFLEYYSNDRNYSVESVGQFLYQIKTSTYIGYSCIMMTINLVCKCRNKSFGQILRALKSNQHLRYKTKTIQMYYYIKKDPRYAKNIPIYTSPRDISFTISDFSFPNQFLKGTQNIDNMMKNEDVTDAIIDNHIYKKINLHNCVLNQTFLEASCDNNKPSMTILSEFEDSIQQKILTYLELDVPQAYYGYNLRSKFYELIQISTNVDIYFYNINPSLAIIINNYHFTEPQEKRVGSDRDVVHLIRELKIKQIPYILLQDFSLIRLMELFEYLKMKDFHALKSFLFVMMSHGDSDHVVYTGDGHKLNIMKDIVSPIQSNISLKDIEKLLVFINCRGTKHPYLADHKQLKEINDMLPTDASQLDGNTVLLFSVRESVLSPRYTTTGTPIVQSLIKHLRNMQPDDDITVLHGKIENDLKKVRYFRKLTKCTELVMNAKHRSSCILQTPTCTLEMFELIQSLRNYFSYLTLTSIDDDDVTYSGYYNICVVVKKTKISRNDFLSKYSAAKLDEDSFSSNED